MTFTTIMAYPATASLPTSDFGVKSPYLMMYFIWNVETGSRTFGMKFYNKNTPSATYPMVVPATLSMKHAAGETKRKKSNFTNDQNGGHVPTIKLAYMASDCDTSSKFE